METAEQAAPAAPEQSNTPTPPEPTPRAAIERAFEQVERDHSGADPEAQPDPDMVAGEKKPDAKADKKEDAKAAEQKASEPEKKDAGPERGPDGKFKSKEAVKEGEKPAEKAEDGKKDPETAKEAETDKTPFSDAPKRFSEDAKGEWKNAPKSVQAEAHRALNELEAGIEKYKADATEYEALKPYADLAKQYDTSIKATLDQFLNLSRGLQSQDPMPAVQELLRHAGMTPQQYVEKISGQAPEHYDAQRDQTIMALENKIDQLSKQLSGVTENVQENWNVQTQREVEAFAAEHPRFEELGESIAAEINAGYDLSEAYRRAELLNPAPAPAPEPQPEVPAPDPEAQTRKASLSTTGAPAPGSDPAKRGPSSSARDSLKYAFNQVGVR